MARKKILNEGKIYKTFDVNGNEWYLVENLIDEIRYYTLIKRMADADTYLRVYSLDDYKKVKEYYLDKPTERMLEFKPKDLKMDIFSYGNSLLCGMDVNNKILYDWRYKITNGDIVVLRSYRNEKTFNILIEENRLNEDFPKAREIVEENLPSV